MSKIEDGTVFGTITHAKAGTCQDCGKALDWKEPTEKGGIELFTAEHCDRKYSISPSQYVVNEVLLPKKEEEKKDGSTLEKVEPSKTPTPAPAPAPSTTAKK